MKITHPEVEQYIIDIDAEPLDILIDSITDGTQNGSIALPAAVSNPYPDGMCELRCE